MIIPETDGNFFTGLCEVDDNNLSILNKSLSLEKALSKAEHIYIRAGNYFYDITNADDSMTSADTFDNSSDIELFGKYIRKNGLFTESFVKAITNTDEMYLTESDTPSILGDWCKVSLCPDGQVFIYPNKERQDFTDEYGCCVSPYFVKNKTGSYIVEGIEGDFDVEELSWTLGVYGGEVGICIGGWDSDYWDNDYYKGNDEFVVQSFCSLTSNKIINMRETTKEETRHILLGDLDYAVQLISCS